MAEEIWKSVDGYEGLFEVSSFGRVRSVQKRDRRGHLHKSRIMKQQMSKTGYRIVTFTVNGKGSTKKVHRLVATAFLPNPENKPEVNHLDGNTCNNNVSNLEWATPSENILHSFRELGRKPSGNCISALSVNKKLTDEQAELVRHDTRIAEEIAREYGVCKKTIYRIKNGLTYHKAVS